MMRRAKFANNAQEIVLQTLRRLPLNLTTPVLEKRHRIYGLVVYTLSIVKFSQ